jgi:SAM-dependent methyltransferase
MRQVLGDLSGAMVSLLCAAGDRLGLFGALAAGPGTSAELAARAGVSERYLREWLSALACAGYLDYDPGEERFSLPPEHALMLAQEGGPMFLGGGYEQLLGLTRPLDLLVGAFRDGGGVAQDAYGEHLPSGMERMSASWFENALVPQWLSLLPGVVARLEDGAAVADVGCGSGRAVTVLAGAFPRSRFVGYDVFTPALERARERAAALGLDGRVRFVPHDVQGGLPEQFDLITTFDSVHDFTDPVAGLSAIRRALRPGGTYLLVEMNCSDRLEENAGPVGALLYATSVLYNLPVTRARGGEGLGTLGLPEARVRRLCAEAGFGSVRRLPVTNPFNVLYDVKP